MISSFCSNVVQILKEVAAANLAQKSGLRAQGKIVQFLLYRLESGCTLSALHVKHTRTTRTPTLFGRSTAPPILPFCFRLIFWACAAGILPSARTRPQPHCPILKWFDVLSLSVCLSFCLSFFSLNIFHLDSATGFTREMLSGFYSCDEYWKMRVGRMKTSLTSLAFFTMH